jgi:hypothetical protein
MERLYQPLSLGTKGCCVWETHMENFDQWGKDIEKYKEQ